ncbi:hypothetical protein QOT17_009305 [Balamuthia mandrillaris]
MSEQQGHAPGDENDSKGLGTTDKENTGVMPSLATTVPPEDASSSMAEARAATWNRSAFRNIHSPQRMFMSDPSLSTLKAPPSPGASCWKQGCHCHNFVSNYWQKHFCGNCLHEATFHRRRRHPLPPSPSTLLQLSDGNNFNNNAGEEDESIETDLVKIDKEERYDRSNVKQREIEGMGAVGPKPSTTFAAKKDEVQQLREMVTEDLFAKLGQHSTPAALSPSSSSPTSFVDRIAARTKRPKKNKKLLDQNKETVIVRSSSAPGETIAEDVAWMFARQRKKNKQKQQEHMKRDEEQDERRTWLKETEKQRIDDRSNVAFVDSFKRVIEEIVEEQQQLELQLMALSQVLSELEASKQQQCISVGCCFTEGERAEYVMLSRKRKQRYLHLKSKYHKEQKLRREAEKDLREATYARLVTWNNAINNKLKKKDPTILEDNDKVATNNELLYLEEKRAHEQSKRTLEQRIAELEKQLAIYQKKKQIKWDRRQHKRRSSAFHQVVPLIFAAEPPLDQLDDEEEGDALESIADQLVKAQKLILSATHQVNDLSNQKPSQYPARRQQQQREATTDRRRAREHRYRQHNASTWDHRQHSRCQLEEAEERNGEKQAERTKRRFTARSLRRATMRRWTMHPAEFQRSSSAPKTTMYKEQEANKEESV